MKKMFYWFLLLLMLIPMEASSQTTYLVRYREHATDCTALTDGRFTDQCYEDDSQSLYKCKPNEGNAGVCDSSGEWKLIAGGATGGGAADTAIALASNPVDCTSGQYANAIAANGDLTCAQILFSQLSGSVTDAQVPDTITAANYLPLTGGTLVGDLIVPEEAYSDVSWDGSLEVPTKNSVRDKIEAIVLASASGDITAAGNCGTGAAFGGSCGNTLTSTTQEVIDLSTANTFIYARDDAGDIVFQGKDDDSTANTIYDTTGAGFVQVGSADVTSVPVITDGGTITLDGDIALGTNKTLGLGTSAGNIKFTDASTDTVSIQNAYLGIGTTAPDQLVMLNGASGSSGSTPITLKLNSTDNGTFTDESIISQILFTSLDITGSAGTRGAIKLYADDTTLADTGLSFFTTTNGNTGIREGMRLDHQGNLGIGTTAPAQPLSVYGGIELVDIVAPSAPTGVAGASTGMDGGNYKYKVTYYLNNAIYQTEGGTASSTIAIGANGSCTLTIPVSSQRVTGRRIYRNNPGTLGYYFVANVADNTTTTYTDTASDATVAANAAAPSTTTASGVITQGSSFVLKLDTRSMYFGLNAGQNATGPGENTGLVGDGTDNVMIGPSAGQYISTAGRSTGVGYKACSGSANLGVVPVTGNYNDCFGEGSGNSLQDATRISAYGFGAAGSIKSGRRLIAIGVDNNHDDVAESSITMGYHTGNTLDATDGIANVQYSQLIGHETLAASNYTGVISQMALIGNEIEPLSYSTSYSNGGCFGYRCKIAESNTLAFMNLSTPFKVAVGNNVSTAQLHVINQSSWDSFRIDDVLNDTTPSMRIDPAGNVGIATTNPAATLPGLFIVAPPATQVVAAGNAITADACGTVKNISSATAVTTGTVNSFTDPTTNVFVGCCMTVHNVNASDSITIDSNAKTILNGGTDLVLGAQDTMQICGDSTYWYQVGTKGDN